jgi:ATP-dependent helicase HrpB
MGLSVQRSKLPIQLPIDALLPGIVNQLRKARCLVIEAAPGAGKTTRVPPSLLEFGPVLVLEPRRIAARLAARRVAEEMGEKPGETVGFQVRFEEVAGPKTRLRFLTEGVLTRRMISDPELKGIGTVVLDEFHERHLESDLALALLRRLQKTKRPELRIVVMSATLDAAPVAKYLDDCETVRSGGRLFELAVTHLPYSPAALEEQVAMALPKLQTKGDVLVFLPGAAEIRRTQRLLAGRSELVLPLYGDLTPAEQDAAVTAAERRKIILATNIAESSITIDGVAAVIDSGLARVASDSPWTGMPRLDVARISKASAKQRAGRAGRQGAGEALRLYTAEDFYRRPDHDVPEIARRELSQVCLQLEAMGIHHPYELEWLDPPPEASVAAAETLLDRLHARGASAARMAKLPLHPRLARLVLEADSEDGCVTAALVSSGERTRSTDLLQALGAPLEGRTRATYDQIRRAVRPGNKGRRLEMAVLAAFPDRVMKTDIGFVVAIDVEERSDQPAAIVRLACGIQPDWLMDLFPERIRERNGAVWNKAAERVEAVSALLYDELVITETRGGVPDREQAAQLLLAAGAEKLIDREGLEAFLARVEFAAQHAKVEAISEEDIREAVVELCRGATRLSEVKGASITQALSGRVNRRLLDEIAPERLRLPGGRQTKVNYERGKTPWVASRLQDFFGMRESPRVANGKVPLVLHLLAPNQRAVQTTTDLAGFWERLYPQVRKELGRRYPRHKWPEEPV